MNTGFTGDAPSRVAAAKEKESKARPYVAEDPWAVAEMQEDTGVKWSGKFPAVTDTAPLTIITTTTYCASATSAAATTINNVAASSTACIKTATVTYTSLT